MKYKCDLHIHTCLSPCGDEEMTPNNIVNLAKIAGIDVIAVTDHNTAKNARAVISAGKKAGVVVIPGMELETSEEVHVLLLFDTVEGAEACGEYVESKRFKIANKTEVYGTQVIMNDMDEPIGEIEDLLVTATTIGVYDTIALAAEYGGIAIPAHVDKPSNGILAVLGDINDDMGFRTLEVSPFCGEETKAILKGRGYKIITDSDSHCLDVLAEAKCGDIETDKLSLKDVLNSLK